MEAAVVTFTLIIVRIATFWFTLPIFGQVSPPRTIKVGLAFGLAIFWYSQLDKVPPGVIAATNDGINWFELAFLCIREILIGGMLGFAFHLFVVPARIAGSYLAQELGLSMAALSDPSSPESSTVVSTVLQLVAILLFFLLNIHHLMIYLLDAVFKDLPVASAISTESSGVLVEGFANLVNEGIGIIGPASIALLILLVAILLLAKSAPAFNLFSVGLSVRLGAGFLAILIFLPDMLRKVSSSFSTAEQYLAEFVRSLIHV